MTEQVGGSMVEDGKYKWYDTFLAAADAAAVVEVKSKLLSSIFSSASSASPAGSYVLSSLVLSWKSSVLLLPIVVE